MSQKETVRNFLNNQLAQKFADTQHDNLQAQTIRDSLKLERELIKEAWQAQNACNLSGVVFSFSRAMEQLCEIQRVAYPHTGTEWKNQHIVSKLYASKLVSLAGDLPLEHWVYLEN